VSQRAENTPGEHRNTYEELLECGVKRDRFMLGM
jgi:hypothetical protein